MAAVVAWGQDQRPPGSTERERWGRISRGPRLAAQSAARRLPGAQRPGEGDRAAPMSLGGRSSVRDRKEYPKLVQAGMMCSVSRACIDVLGAVGRAAGSVAS